MVQVMGYKAFGFECPQQFVEFTTLRLVATANEHRQAGTPGLERQLAGGAQAARGVVGGENVELDSGHLKIFDIEGRL
jgi:hypothetical protein